MRHVFILNPVAGKRHLALELKSKIEAYFAEHKDKKHEIYITEEVGAATRIAQDACAADDDVRLYACGGDGTLQETANGIPADSKAELTAIPCGSGNDYIRIFGKNEDFLNIPDLIEGEAVPVDAVDCDGKLSLNIASIGMDAKVCANMTKFKQWPLVGGSLAYELAIVNTFCTPIGDDLEIEIESEQGPVRREGKYLLALAANGQYYGGGYHGAPQAVENDGILDFVLVKRIPRLAIPKFLSKYKAGDYEDLDCCEHIRGTSMRVKSKKPTFCNVDGECFKKDRMTFSIVPKAFRFVIPKVIAVSRRVMGAPKAPAL